ncbi:hypothetical protein Lesp02_16520 [Lentzea sp. NBRC 105346]|nr:hypothetical protein Lesp02_16520 [Lentzea sp. NBRC 105346]
MDANDPAKLADFWAQALDYIPQPPPPGFDTWPAFLEQMGIPKEDHDKAAALVDASGKGPRIFFQKVPEGKTAKNRVHLDVNPSGTRGDKKAVAEHVAKLEGLGARRVKEFDEPMGYWITMLDPEGNEFCVH